MPSLFDPLTLRGLKIKNRIWLPPMCQYSCCTDGKPTAWQTVHYGARAVGGVGLIIVEATAVTPEGRISPADCGLWENDQIAAFASLSHLIKAQGCAAGIQLAHAGRKAATKPPREGSGPLESSDPRAWETLSASALPFSPSDPAPRAMTEEEILQTVEDFRLATRRAIRAGFDVIQIHSAHGYLLHSFLSPLTNKRQDKYGMSLEGRMRFPLAVAKAVREETPDHLPVTVRVSATDWVVDGWDLPQTIAYCKALKEIGIDLIDVSTGGLVPNAIVPVAPNYQVSFSEAIRRDVDMPVSVAGLITEARQAEKIIQSKRADAVCLGRELLRTPHWPLRAASELGIDVEWPFAYERSKKHFS